MQDSSQESSLEYLDWIVHDLGLYEDAKASQTKSSHFEPLFSNDNSVLEETQTNSPSSTSSTGATPLFFDEHFFPASPIVPLCTTPPPPITSITRNSKKRMRGGDDECRSIKRHRPTHYDTYTHLPFHLRIPTGSLLFSDAMKRILLVSHFGTQVQPLILEVWQKKKRSGNPHLPHTAEYIYASNCVHLSQYDASKKTNYYWLESSLLATEFRDKYEFEVEGNGCKFLIHENQDPNSHLVMCYFMCQENGIKIVNGHYVEVRLKSKNATTPLAKGYLRFYNSSTSRCVTQCLHQ